MSHLTHIAKPYVGALMDLSKDDNSWLDVMQVCRCFSDDDNGKFLASRSLSGERKVLLIRQVLINANVAAPEAFTSFLDLLAKNKRLSILGDIASLFVVEKKKEAGVLSAEVTSAMPLEKEAIDKLKKNILELNKGYQAIELETHVDASLIAGVTIKIGDHIIDSSIKGKLNELSDTLI